DWGFVVSTAGGAERRAEPRQAIRAVARGGAAGTVLDPIGAVCAARTGRFYPADKWIQAATEIGLSLIDAADLVAAANERTWRQLEGRREPDAYMQGLRDRMERALGLTGRRAS